MIEWIDGVLELLPSLSQAQQRVRNHLLALLGDYVEENGIGLVIPAPFAIRMPEEMRRGREPDLLFIPNEFVETVQESYVNSHGVGLVIEITDARSRRLDKIEKFHDYQLAGIPEYWIVDVDRREVLFFSLTHNRYRMMPLDARGRFRSRVLKGFTLSPDSLWS